jgi:Transposase DDE domain
VHADLDDLATALYVWIDDHLLTHPEHGPERPEIGIAPKLSDAELVTLAVMQALLGFTSEARWLRHAHDHLTAMFPALPATTSAYNKRLRKAAGLMQHLITSFATSCPSYTDDIWLVDSTPVECGRSRQTTKRSDLAGWAGYGYCSSHSRYFWGLRLHLITTPSGLPVAFALTNPKIDERDVAADMITIDHRLHRPGPQTLIADKGYRRAAFERDLTEAGITLIRPALKGEAPRPLQRFLKPFRQTIESVNQTFKAQLDLERHGGRTPTGVWTRVLQRILALTTVIWHNETTNQPGPARSLLAYDH